MITKFAGKREVKNANGKVYVKRPKIQRLITPQRLRRRRFIKKIKQERQADAKESVKKYHTMIHDYEKDLKRKKAATKKAKVVKK